MSPELEQEIETRLDGFDPENGTVTRNDVLRELIEDCEDRDRIAHDFRDELHEFGIRLGIFRETSLEEMERSYVTRGKKYDFKRGGKFYVFESWKLLED